MIGLRRPLAGAALLLIALATPGLAAELRGHGGPVRAVAVAPDGRSALSGSFDQSAILWSLETASALAVLRLHDGAVNAVAFLPDGGFATGGEDGRIALWRPGNADPERTIPAHNGPIAGLAVPPAGSEVASASWDGTVRVISLAGRPDRVFEGHAGNVNAVAYLPDGRLASAGYDGSVRIWPRGEGAPIVAQLATPVSALVAAPDGEIAAAGADGTLRFLDAGGTELASLVLGTGPVTALALSPDGSRIAAASISGAIAVVDRPRRSVMRRLARPGGPVWSLAFVAGANALLAGGNDRVLRRWDLERGETAAGAAEHGGDPLAAFAGERGAELFRACVACHTLTPDGGNRAGPTLHGVFGRRIAAAPGYNYSPALKGMDIVWNADTIARLFEVGPAAYTPGTKMPEQRLTDPADRAALVGFLERATKPR